MVPGLKALACFALAVMSGRAEADKEAPSTSTYPTTVTRSWTRTSTYKLPPGITNDPSLRTTAAILKITQVDAWPFSPNPEEFPYTLSQTGVTDRVDVVISSRTTISTLSSASRTATSTWVLWDTAATDLPKGQALPPCERCVPPSHRPDPRCKKKGLETRCHSQCRIREVEGRDVWWCQKRRTGDGTGVTALGRVCAGGGKHYQQLLEPCFVDDERHDCPLCLGRDEL